MKNFGKIISDKDIITKEYLDSKGYISAITSKMVTDALGFTPFDSAAFTKTSIKNALGIADWALAANKPSYNFSEIGSKPTTLSGYGITDAVKYGSGFAPTAADSPTIIGYSGGGEGWPSGGPAMRWGTVGYYTRLNVDIWENNPTMMISNMVGDTATEWATFVTSLNVGKYAMKVDSAISSSVNLNEVMTPGAYNTWAGSNALNAPSGSATFLVVASKNSYFTSQLLTDVQGHIFSRMNEGGGVDGWRPWRTIVDTDNIGDYAISKAGGTITGDLTVNGKVSASGLSISTATASLTFTDNIIYSNASLRIYGGWSLRLGANATGIQEWTDLKTVLGLGSLAYKNSIEASDISSIAWDKITGKPTTLSGYGITDAVRHENSITPTASPNVMGYAGGGEGWPVSGPVMVWGTSGYFARLCVNIWETNPTMLISCLAGADATEWATFVTSLNVGQYAMKVDSGILSGANLNELMTPGSYNNWAGVSNSPTSAESTILVISSKTNYLTSQILTNSQGHLYSRMNEGGTWSSWRTILDADNIGTVSLPSLNLNGETITSWSQVRTRWAKSFSAVDGNSAQFDVNENYKKTIVTTLTNVHTITFNLLSAGTGIAEWICCFTTGNTTPTINLIGQTSGNWVWQNGVNILNNLEPNTRYRLHIDGNMVMYTTFK